MYFHLNVLVNFIINSYFTSSNCLLIFGNNLTEFEYSGNIPFVLIQTNGVIREDVIFRYYGCQGIVIFGYNSKRIFENFETAIRFTIERFNHRKYLILPMDNSSVFDSESIEFVTDLLVIKKQHASFGLYTHQYIGKGNNTKNVIEIDNWFSNNQSFFKNENLYPDKLRNQMGRDLRIATFTYKPYSIPANLDGTEIFIILEFAKKYNMTPKLVVDEIGEWGEVFDNWTGYGILGNLVTDRGDIGLGALYIWEHVYHFLDIAKSVLRSGITCMTPAPKLIGGWITPFVSFSWQMWVMTFISFIVAFLAIFLVITFKEESRDGTDKLEKLMRSLMLTQAIFLLQGVSKIPTNSLARVVFALALLLSFMMDSLYSSGLASNMTVPRYSGMIRNVEDLAQSDLEWGATSVAWISALFDDNNVIYKKVVNNFVAANQDELLKMNDENFGFAVERLHGGNYAIGSYITRQGIQKRRLMDHDVDWEHSVMMLRKSSVLLPKLDRLLLEISQAGLLYIWEYEMTVKTSDMKLQQAVRLTTHPSRPDKIKLTLSHVEGAFALWCIGIATSITAFFCELLYFKKSQQC